MLVHCVCVPGAHRAQKTVFHSLGLELQMVVNFCVDSEN